MPKVNIAEIEKEASKQAKARVEREIVEREVGSKKYFKGPYSEDWFDDYGDCLNENSRLKRIKDFENEGLDEFGRTPELIKLAEAKAKLMQKRADLLKQVKGVDDEIRSLKASDFEEKKSTKKAK